MWTEISKYILHPKFKEVCTNIAKRSGLHDDLYQELILTLLEKIKAEKEPLLRAWENKYLDWYIVSAAHTIFHSKNGSNFSKLRQFHPELKNMDSRAYQIENSTETYEYDQFKYNSNSTGDTQATFQQTDNEIEFDEMIRLCETELAGQYWYGARLFAQYVFEDSSIRKIEQKTMIPRNSIHRTLKDTKKMIVKNIFKKKWDTLLQTKGKQSIRDFSHQTGIPKSTLHRMVTKAEKLKLAAV